MHQTIIFFIKLFQVLAWYDYIGSFYRILYELENANKTRNRLYFKSFLTLLKLSIPKTKILLIQ